MRIEICGKGFLGVHAFEYFSRIPSYSVSFSDKTFQYVEGTLELNQATPDVLINLSGPTSIDESFRHPYLYREFPSFQVKTHLELLNSLPKPPHYIFVSTAAVYGECNFHPADESNQLSPLSPYAEGKVLAENLISSVFTDYKGSITIFRATSVFHEDLNSRVLSKIRTSFISETNLELYGDGTEVRDYIYTEDFFAAVNLVIIEKRNRTQLDVFNLGSGHLLSINQVVELAKRANGFDPRYSNVYFNGIRRVGDPLSMCVSLDRIRSFVDLNVGNPVPHLLNYFQYKI